MLARSYAESHKGRLTATVTKGADDPVTRSSRSDSILTATMSPHFSC